MESFWEQLLPSANSDVKDAMKVIKAQFDKLLLDLDPKNKKLIEGFEAKFQQYKNEHYIFKVRDKYESIVDIKSLLPYYFSRSINEGSFHQKQTLVFNQKANEVMTQKSESFKTADCTFDVISAVYAVRNLDFSNLQVNEKVYLNFFLDNELHPSYFKYLGKEIIQTRYGKFKAIKIAPLLVKGSMFEGGELMTIWVTDDDNHIPIRIETPIIVGSIKADMKKYEGLRHPLTAMIE
jgi:hypothetical protein